MLADILIEDDRWQAEHFERLAAAAFDEVAGHLNLRDVEISVMACDDARITELNSEFRDKGQPTNVLSWPSEERAADEPGGKPMPPIDHELGDIAISFDTCQREAEQQGKNFSAHVSHLLVHGLLHLLGYDHIHDKDAALMEGLEVEILGKMGISNPYID